MEVVIVIVIVVLAILFLRGFDRVAGRGPKQVSDGVERAERKGSPAEDLQPATERRNAESQPAQHNSGATADESQRIPCPECAELIMPAAQKCRFCGADLTNRDDD